MTQRSLFDAPPETKPAPARKATRPYTTPRKRRERALPEGCTTHRARLEQELHAAVADDTVIYDQHLVGSRIVTRPRLIERLPFAVVLWVQHAIAEADDDELARWTISVDYSVDDRAQALRFESDDEIDTWYLSPHSIAWLRMHDYARNRWWCSWIEVEIAPPHRLIEAEVDPL